MTTHGRPADDDTAEVSDRGSTDHVDLDGDPFADDLSDQLAERAPRRIVTRTTIALGVLALLVAGFVGGTQVQKRWGESSTSAQSNPFAGLGSGFPQIGASGIPGGFPTGTGTGQQTDTGSQGTGGGTTGKVKLIDGNTVYIVTTDGQTITVKTGTGTAVQIPKKGSVKDLKTGSTVTVDGTTGSDGTVAATKITKSD
ncbi:hypothetical protein [Actinoplanes subtropicus]|uniref:hypothetical protein n=1 Tax=Actinoplanes subtropicus TaxID=543632 RepID=UPI000552C666|nr:hypothetical protein [Actinoplanes subtropicus]